MHRCLPASLARGAFVMLANERNGRLGGKVSLVIHGAVGGEFCDSRTACISSPSSFGADLSSPPPFPRHEFIARDSDLVDDVNGLVAEEQRCSQPCR